MITFQRPPIRLIGRDAAWLASVGYLVGSIGPVRPQGGSRPM